MGDPLLPVTLAAVRLSAVVSNVKRHKKAPGVLTGNPSFDLRKRRELLTLPVSAEAQSTLTTPEMLTDAFLIACLTSAFRPFRSAGS